MSKPAEAEAEYRKALAVQQKLADDNPAVPQFRRQVVSSLSSVGRIQQRDGRTSEAAASFRRAIAILKRLPTSTPGDLYDLACNQALFAGAAVEPGSRVSAAEGQAEADRAMETLRRAVAHGFRRPIMGTDTDLDPLRARPDFQLLMMDLAMPADPFSGPR